MKTIEQLEKELEKENQLIEKHKKNVADIKKQIEYQRGILTTKAVNSLNLTGKELKQFLKLLIRSSLVRKFHLAQMVLENHILLKLFQALLDYLLLL